MLNSIINDNCLNVMRKMEDESIDLTITDPPYGISLAPPRETSKFHDVRIENDDELSWVPEFYSELFRITKNVSYIFCGWSNMDVFIAEAKKAGFTVKNVLVWDKMHFGLGHNFRPRYELILLLTKKTFTTKRNDLANILSFKRMHHSKMLHVAEKPIDLLKLLIEESSEERDVVFDPFSGSGSTLDAAKQLNRKYIGVELDKDYCKIIEDRLSD